MNTGRGEGQVREREATQSPEEAVAAQQSASGQRKAWTRLARRVMLLALLASMVALAVLGVARLLELRQRALYPGGDLGGQSPAILPTYQFVWQADAPGSLSAMQAFAAEGQVVRTSDGAKLPPVATLWVGQSADAALVIVQMDADGHWLAVVPLVRSGNGSSAVWHASAGTWPTSRKCSGSAMSPSGNCSESMVHSPAGSPLPEMWDWSAADGTVAVAVHFAQPLLAPPQGGQLAGLTLSVGDARATDGSTLVVVGTASAAVEQQQAKRLAATV